MVELHLYVEGGGDSDLLRGRYCKTKGAYVKGNHSFVLLGLIDPEMVKAASPSAKQFVEALTKRMGR